MNRNHLIYAGVGVFAILVIYYSTRKVYLQEVLDPSMVSKNFDASSLPYKLRPPYRLAEGEPMQTARNGRRLNITGLSLKPRFDQLML